MEKKRLSPMTHQKQPTMGGDGLVETGQSPAFLGTKKPPTLWDWDMIYPLVV